MKTNADDLYCRVDRWNTNNTKIRVDFIDGIVTCMVSLGECQIVHVNSISFFIVTFPVFFRKNVAASQ